MNRLQPKIVYSPDYDIRFLGLEKLHPFDSCKYSRAWESLLTTFGSRLKAFQIQPESAVTVEELRTVHTDAYLQKLNNARYVANVLALPELGFLPQCLLDKHVLKAMQLATTGTVLAAHAAIAHGIAINLSGGYHHASRDRGEGFCVYSDIAIAIALLRQSKTLQADDQVIIIDLDAHQGNGLERIFFQDQYVHIFDMYNEDIYPQDWWAKEWINYKLPLKSGTSDRVYLAQLKDHLPRFLSDIKQPRLAFYNAGTDIFEGDPLGRLNVSEQGILERDRYVFKTLTAAAIPWVMVLSGGYTRQSYQLVANAVTDILQTWSSS